MLGSSLSSALSGPVLITVTLALTAILVAISVIDLRQYRIPDVLSLPLIGAGVAVAYLQPNVAIAPHLIGAGAGFLVLAVIGEVYFRRNGTEGLGLGDAKLFSAAGAWLDWTSLPLVLLMAAGGGLLYVAVSGSLKKRAGIAFGPWLALAFWLVWMHGAIPVI